MKLVLKILLSCLILVSVLFCGTVVCYKKVLPYIVSNEKCINKLERTAKKYINLDVDIKNPKLKTGFNPIVGFTVDDVLVTKETEKLLEVKNFDIEISLKNIFKKVIIINKFGADNLYIDADKLIALLPSGEKNSEQKTDWEIDLFNSLLYLNKSLIIYTPVKGTQVKLIANNLNVDNSQRDGRLIHFDLNADITKNNKTVHIAIKDDNKVFIKDKKLQIKDCPLEINYSKMFFDAWANKNDYEINVFAKRFFIPDLIKLLQTDIIENNINEPLEIIKDLNGDFDFNLKITKNDISGDINFNRISAKLASLNDLPFLINSGSVILKGNDIELKNFKGFYNKNKINAFEFEGTIKDYLKTIDTHIDMAATLTNEFMSDYLSKIAGVNLTLIGQSKSKIIIESKNNNFDVTMLGKIKQGDDILVDGASLSPVNYDRAMKAVLHIVGDNVNIETINYYIAKELTKKSKGIKPILTLNGNVSASTGKIYDFGFDIPNPLPSEFLNLFVGEKMFRKGQFWGDMHFDATGKVPVLNGNLSAEKIAIPSQRLFLRKGKIKTIDNLVNITAEGKFRRTGYDLKGNILNELLFPIRIKDISLTLDDVDIERFMQAINTPAQAADYTKEEIDDNDDTTAMAFDIKNLIIENCILTVLKGKYKEINFANVIANMSLDKNSIFKLHSNRFEIAEGHSSADVNCDLKNKKYSLKLGIKDVDSNIISTTLLNLPREISGKGSGLIDINTDESLKLNGAIKFVIKDGTIQKIGLVEYILKFAALFRNPLAMISPSIFSDMVNVPEGKFDKITGDIKLKDNKIELMKIKSYSASLSAYIVGCYNLENSDAILRIYTKFSNKNKGFAGFLRNFSLNSLANRIPLNSRNDSNYYAAELEQLPDIDANEKDCQIFLTKVDGDLEHNNFISSLKKIK